MKVRDTVAQTLKQEHESVTAMMDALRAQGEEVKARMLAEQKGHQAAMEALQDLSSRDLTILIGQEKPDNEVMAAMNGVMILLRQTAGWESV